MSCYYLDASAWIKYYRSEIGSDWISRLFNQSSSTLASSKVGFIEVLATLANKRKIGDFTLQEFSQKAKDLENDWKGFTKIHLSDSIIHEAKNFLEHHYLEEADTIHLCSAILLNNQLSSINSELIFITSDTGLKKAAKSKGLTVLDPNDYT